MVLEPTAFLGVTGAVLDQLNFGTNVLYLLRHDESITVLEKCHRYTKELDDLITTLKPILDALPDQSNQTPSESLVATLRRWNDIADQIKLLIKSLENGKSPKILKIIKLATKREKIDNLLREIDSLRSTIGMQLALL
jgi:hypothetical protein